MCLGTDWGWPISDNKSSRVDYYNTYVHNKYISSSQWCFKSRRRRSGKKRTEKQTATGGLHDYILCNTHILFALSTLIDNHVIGVKVIIIIINFRWHAVPLVHFTFSHRVLNNCVCLAGGGKSLALFQVHNGTAMVSVKIKIIFEFFI